MNAGRIFAWIFGTGGDGDENERVERIERERREQANRKPFTPLSLVHARSRSSVDVIVL